jgi:hypothetical protein
MAMMLLVLAAPATAQVSAPVDGRSVIEQTGEDRIRSLMETRGYSDIGEMRREGEVLHVTEALRFGEPVRDVRVDAQSGQVQAEAPLSAEQVARLLEARGYTQVAEIERNATAITTRAHQNDRTWRLRIDATRGTVLQQQAGE